MKYLISGIAFGCGVILAMMCVMLLLGLMQQDHGPSVVITIVMVVSLAAGALSLTWPGFVLLATNWPVPYCGRQHRL